MSQLPWYQRNPHRQNKRFLSEKNLAVIGAVAMLEDFAWTYFQDNGCILPDDRDLLQRGSRMTSHQWGHLGEKVLSYFRRVEGGYLSFEQESPKLTLVTSTGTTKPTHRYRLRSKDSQLDLPAFEHESIGPLPDHQPARVIEAQSEKPVEKIQTNQGRLAPSAVGPFAMPQIAPQPRSKTWDRDEDPRPHDHPARRAAEAQARADAEGKVDAQNLIRDLLGGLGNSMAMARDGPAAGRQR